MGSVDIKSGSVPPGVFPVLVFQNVVYPPSENTTNIEYTIGVRLGIPLNGAFSYQNVEGVPITMAIQSVTWVSTPGVLIEDHQPVTDSTGAMQFVFSVTEPCSSIEFVFSCGPANDNKITTSPMIFGPPN
jgi:hypothetical protein